MKTSLKILTVSIMLASTAAYAETVTTDGKGNTVIVEDDGTTTIIDGNSNTVTEYDRGVKTTITGNSVTEQNYDYNQVITELKAEQVGNDLIVELPDSILFDFNKTDITPRSAATLSKLSYLIKQSRKGYVQVYGHTDSKGTDEYNQKLSDKRANSVVYWLTAQGGVDGSVLRPQGMGEQFPVADNNSDAGRAENRRVEVVIQTDAPREIQGYYRGAVVSSGCNIVPTGAYRYLFSDGFQNYYFNNKYTIYVDSAGNQVLEQGDFRHNVGGSIYQRQGNQFTFINENGTYTSNNGGTINFKPSASIDLSAYGASYTDTFGTYRQAGKSITFTPARQLPDLVVTSANCSTIRIQSK